MTAEELEAVAYACPTASSDEFFHVLPPFGAPGVCADFDEDCWLVGEQFEEGPSERAWALCWQYDPERGACPFVD